MLKMRVIPCLDVHAGRVVKGVNFVDLVDAGDPVEQARVYDDSGARTSLCFLDITASHEQRDTIYDVVAGTAEVCFHAAHRGRRGANDRGCPRGCCWRAPTRSRSTPPPSTNPAFVAEAAEKFGTQCIVVAVDAKRVAGGGFEIFTHGGRKPTGIDAIAMGPTHGGRGRRRDSC